jgi:DHA2 family methylenomycin A resistance protein-like MFS transporter
MSRRFIDETRVAQPRPIDWRGQLVVTVTLVCLTDGIIEAGETGWASAHVLAALAAAALLLALFVRLETVSRAPVLPGHLFRSRLFSLCVAIGAALNFGMYGVLFIESLYLQNIRHLSPLASGLLILPFTVTPAATTRLIGRYTGRQHLIPRLAVGLLFAAAGGGLLALVGHLPGDSAILLGLGLMGVGMGCIMPAMTAGVLTSSVPQTAGLASGILNSARQVGGALGVALMGSLVQSLGAAGYLVSFAVVMTLYLLMAAVTLRVAPEPPPA